MSIAITHPAAAGAWLTAFNPIIYEYFRKDYLITATANNGGALQITVNANLTTLTTAKGGAVVPGSILSVAQFRSVPNQINDWKIFDLTVVSITNAANSVIVFQAGSYSLSDFNIYAPAYVNLKQRIGYYVRADIYVKDNFTNVNNVWFLLFSLRSTHKKSGQGIFDIQAISRVFAPTLVSSASLSVINNDNGYQQLMQNKSVAREFYVVFTEVWNNSAEVGIQSNYNYIVHGSAPDYFTAGLLQSNDISYYYTGAAYLGVPRKFLTPVTKLKTWPGKPFYTSFIQPSFTTVSPELFVKVGRVAERYKNEFNSNGLIFATFNQVPIEAQVNENGIYDHVYTGKEYQQLVLDWRAEFGVSAYPQSTLNGGTAVWDKLLGVTVPNNGKSKVLHFPLQVGVGSSCSFTITLSGGSGVRTFTAKLYDSYGGAYSPISFNIVNAQPHNFTLSLPFGEYDPTTTLGIEVSAVTSQYLYITNFRILEPSYFEKLEFDLKMLLFNDGEVTTTNVGEVLSYNMQRDDCEGIQLIWRNSIGGSSHYLFQGNHTFFYKLIKGKKMRAYTLTANNVDTDDFNLLSELLTDGLLFDTPIITNTIPAKRTSRLGAHVVLLVGSSSVVVNCYIDTDSIKIKTRAEQHNDIQFDIILQDLIYPK